MKKTYLILFIAILLINLVLANSIYSVNGWLSKTNVKPGEIIELRINFLGEGNITEDKLKVSSDGGTFFVMGDRNTSGSFMGGINPSLFNNNFKDEFSYAEFGQVGFDKVSLMSDKKGDHELLISFLYLDQKGEYSIAEKQLSFHVNTWLERNQTWLIIISIILAVIALFFGGAYNNEIKGWVKKILTNINSYLH